VGDEVAVFDGQGTEAAATVAQIGPAHALLGSLRGVRRSRRDFSVSLIQALPKGARMDLIVEKATELGASDIFPAVSERVVGRLSEEQRRDRVERWRRIAVSAAKQSGAAWLPEIHPVRGLGETLEGLRGAFDLLLVGAIGVGAPGLREALRAAAGRPRRAGLIIGPEGDLSAGELRMAVEAGALQVSFGERILRVETAALYGLCALAYEFSGAAPGPAAP
jgi:16S rRNA (uracil1498-N3)-methyltransferase